MNVVVMIKPEAINGPNGADSLLPRQIYWYLWMPNLLVRETNTEHPVWHCSLRRPTGYWGQVDYTEPFLSWKDHPFNLIWIINTFWVWAFSSSPTQLSAGLQHTWSTDMTSHTSSDQGLMWSEGSTEGEGGTGMAPAYDSHGSYHTRCHWEASALKEHYDEPLKVQRKCQFKANTQKGMGATLPNPAHLLKQRLLYKVLCPHRKYSCVWKPRGGGLSGPAYHHSQWFTGGPHSFVPITWGSSGLEVLVPKGLHSC